MLSFKHFFWVSGHETHSEQRWTFWGQTWAASISVWCSWSKFQTFHLGSFSHFNSESTTICFHLRSFRFPLQVVWDTLFVALCLKPTPVRSQVLLRGSPATVTCITIGLLVPNLQVGSSWNDSKHTLVQNRQKLRWQKCQRSSVALVGRSEAQSRVWADEDIQWKEQISTVISGRPERSMNLSTYTRLVS